MMDYVYLNFPPEGHIISPLTPEEIIDWDLSLLPDIHTQPAGSVKTFDAV